MFNLYHSILCLSFLFIGSSSFAQETLFEELFNDETLGQFTQVSELGDEQTWRAADFGGKFFAQMNGYNNGAVDNIDWLISPAFDMDASDGEILRFENAANFSGPDLELLVSTDYAGDGNPAGATWENLSESVNLSPGGYEYVESGNIDLSSYTGTLYFAFRYNSSEADGAKLFQIDSVTVTATSVTDIIEIEKVDLISAPILVDNQLTFTSYSPNLHFTISTIEGQIISNSFNEKADNEVSIPVGELPQGRYVLLVQSDQSKQSFTFIR